MRRNISENEQKLLQFLMKHEQYISSTVLSKKLGISNKSVQRYVKNLNNKFEVEIIESSQAKGYKLTLEGLRKINEMPYISFPVVRDQNKSIGLNDLNMREVSILTELLIISPQTTSIKKQSDKHYVTEGSIVKHLKIISMYLQKNGLILEKTFEGTRVTGPEQNIRKILMSIYLGQHYFSDDYTKVKKIVDNNLMAFKITLNEPYYTNCIIHLMVLIYRFVHSSNVETSLINHYVPSYYMSISNKVIHEINQEWSVNLKLEDSQSFAIYLLSGVDDSVLTSETSDEPENSELLVDTMIYKIGENIGKNLSNDPYLKGNFMSHIPLMLERIDLGTYIENPILQTIKVECQEAFIAVSKTIDDLSSDYRIFSKISENEIGFITIYIQSALERVSKKLKVLVVCSTGIGSSHLLKTRLQNNFRQLEIIGTTTSSVFNQNNNITDVDLIISTVKLNVPPEVPTVIVSAFLSNLDIKLLRNTINDLKR